MLDMQNPPVPPGLDMGAPLTGGRSHCWSPGWGRWRSAASRAGAGASRCGASDGLPVAAAILVGLVMVIGAVV
ncbi:MAG: hypothetical protein U0521_28170 [Anaerolineae bacterium]